MKKMVLVVFFGLLFFGQIFAQSSPIMGYDQVKWGASVLDVRKAYNLGNSYVLQENFNQDVNIASLVQKNVSDVIKERQFLFNKWKGQYQLYRVWVTYWDDSTAQNLKTGLANRYGERTDLKRDSHERLEVWKETITFGKYSPELIVELFHAYPKQDDFYIPGLGTLKTVMDGVIPLQVCYTWKKLRDEYQARNVQF